MMIEASFARPTPPVEIGLVDGAECGTGVSRNRSRPDGSVGLRPSGRVAPGARIYGGCGG